jgi:hypothetical protein
MACHLFYKRISIRYPYIKSSRVRRAPAVAVPGSAATSSASI